MLVNDNQMVRNPDQMVVIEPRPSFNAVQCVIEVVLQGEGSKMPVALARPVFARFAKFTFPKIAHKMLEPSNYNRNLVSASFLLLL